MRPRRSTTRSPASCPRSTDFQAKYTLLLGREGGILDDLVVYRTGEDRFLVVANAGNREVAVQELRDRCAPFACFVEDESDDIALIALQGPRAEEILRNVDGFDIPDLDGLRYYRAIPGDFRGHNVLVARTGYTGEDGFEFYLAPDAAPALWEAIAETGAGSGLVPAGLGVSRHPPARGRHAALRSRAVDRRPTPLRPDSVAWSRYVEGGRLRRTRGASRKAPAPAHGCSSGSPPKASARAGRATAVYAGDREVGEVTSGALSPTLGHPIAMAYVSPEFAEPGTELELDVRGSRIPASVVSLPFYSRKK